MRRGALLVAWVLAAGCGRVGYDLATGEGTRLGSDASIGSGGTDGGATDGAMNGSGGTGSGDGAVNASSGGFGTTDGAMNQGSGGVSVGGSDGATAASGGADAGVGTGGQPNTGGASGQAGSGGSDSGTYTCTPGAREICDGRDNNCDNVVDEAPACPSRCAGTAWGNHGYMLCDNTSYGWPQAKTECENAGLQLVKIESQEENDFVASLAFAQRNGDVWIGGSDLTTEGDWRWPDGTPFWSGIAGDGGVAVGGAYTHWWTPGEPNNLNGASDGDGDCLVISQTQSFWLDEGCNFFNRALCETP